MLYKESLIDAVQGEDFAQSVCFGTSGGFLWAAACSTLCLLLQYNKEILIDAVVNAQIAQSVCFQT